MTIDASIFKLNSHALESRLLAPLEQFRESESELAVANNVANEVKRGLTKSATEAAKSLRFALALAALDRALIRTRQEAPIEIGNRVSSYDDTRAHKRFDEWAQRVGADVPHEVEFALTV